MYRYRKDGISVLAVVDRRRMKNNGLYPVKIEVVYRRIQKYYPTGKDVSLAEWECFWKSRRISKKFASIENSFNHIRSEVERLADKGEFSFTQLELRLGRLVMTLNDALKKKMEACLEKGRINSFYRYRSTLRAVERFDGKRIFLDAVTAGWLARCEAFWLKEGKSSTTLNIYMKTIRCTFQDALEAGILKESQFPFRKGGYKIPSGTSRKMALTKEDIHKISRWTGNHEVEYWRDLWMFSYLCNGINFKDMIFLKYKNIVDGEISFVRSKTSGVLGKSRIIKAPLTPLMVEIINKRGNGMTGDPEEYIFRHAKGNESPMKESLLVRKVIHKCNDAMKKLASDLNMKAFSTYAARHSFATILKRSGVDISFISESLGHTNTLMTENYLAGYDKYERSRNAEFLLD